MSWITKIYLVAGLLGLSWFGWLGLSGWERDGRTRRTVPAEVQAAPNGYRTFHYWHVGFGGYRGGK